MFFAKVRRKYPNELRADLQRYYGICMDDVGGTVTVRHAAALSACLPKGSMTLAKIEPKTQWGDTEWLLCQLINLFTSEKYDPWDDDAREGTGVSVERYEQLMSMPRKEVGEVERAS